MEVVEKQQLKFLTSTYTYTFPKSNIPLVIYLNEILVLGQNHNWQGRKWTLTCGVMPQGWIWLCELNCSFFILSVDGIINVYPISHEVDRNLDSHVICFIQWRSI